MPIKSLLLFVVLLCFGCKVVGPEYKWDGDIHASKQISIPEYIFNARPDSLGNTD